jgi:hypothetical protein
MYSGTSQEVWLLWGESDAKIELQFAKGRKYEVPPGEKKQWKD